MIIDLAGNLSGRASQFLGSLQRLGNGGSRSMQVLQRSVHAVGQGLDRLGNRYTALITGAAGVGTIKKVGDLSERLTYLGIQANVSRGEVDRLHASILDAAQAPEIRVDPSGILAGIEAIVEKTGDLTLARNNIRNIGLVMRATGADGKDAGDMIANFREKFDLKDAEIAPALDILIRQGKAGAFTLKDLTTQGNRVTAAYGAMGRKGLGAVREMGAVLQVFRKSSGSAEETSTAFKNLFQDLMEPSKQKILQANGIKIWDEEHLKRGQKVIRPITDIIDKILRKSKGDPDKLSRLFGMQTMDGMKAFISTWQSSGKNAALEFLNVQGDGAELMRDSARAAEEFNASMQNIRTSVQRFASSNLMKPVQGIADRLNSLQPATVERWLKLGTGLVALVGAAVAVNQIVGAVRGVGGLFGKGKGAGLPGLGGKGGPIPVYVVNKHLSMLPGQGWGFPGGGPGGTTGKAGKVLGTVGKYAKYAGPVGAAAVAGYGAGTLINKYLVDGTSLGNAIGEGLNRIAAALGNKESKLAIEINSRDGSQARVTRMQSRGMAVNVDSGLMMAGH